jgi:hypothetical protein
MALNTKKACYSFRYYRKILESLKEYFDAHYVVSEIPQIFSQILRPKFIIRHDLRQSLNNGLELAKIERGLSVRASYMIDMLSPNLDLNKKENASIIQEIINLGHEVGLYVFHPARGSGDPKTLGLNEDEIVSQSRHLEALVKKRIYSVSFPKEYSNIPEDSFFIGQKVSASSKILMEEALSDINDLEDHQIFLSKIKNRDKKILQILIHPELWCKE